MSKKKVLQLVEDLRVGGLEKVLATIVLNLDKHKYDVEVWCLAGGGEIADELIDKGVQLKILGLDNYYNPLNVIKLSYLINKAKIDIVHTHGYFAGTFGRLAAILTKRPVVVAHIHTTYFGFKKRNLIIDKILSYFTDKIICVSGAVQKFVVEIEKICIDKTQVIYNGADIGMPEDVKNEDEIEKTRWGITASEIVAVTVASLTPHKGHSVLLKAIRIVLSEYANVKLLVVGTGPLREKLESDASELKISNNIIFTGLQENVAPLLRIADIFVLASTEREGLPISLIEAMAAGLPVVISDLGGVPEAVEKNLSGILFRPGDEKELADAIKKLLASKPLRIGMGRQGRNVYREKFTVQKMLYALETLYDGLAVIT